MDTQTFFTILGTVAGALGVSIYILSLMTKNISLELERRLMEKLDEKFKEYETQIINRLNTFLEEHED